MKKETTKTSDSRDSDDGGAGRRHHRFVVVGLGNPGKQYERTRHNVGFAMVDHLADSWITRAKSMKSHENTDAMVCDLEILLQLDSNERQQQQEQQQQVEERVFQVSLVKPQTFMNLSGNAVSRLVKKWKLPHHSLMILYDDIDLPLGTVK